MGRLPHPIVIPWERGDLGQAHDPARFVDNVFVEEASRVRDAQDIPRINPNRNHLTRAASSSSVCHQASSTSTDGIIRQLSTVARGVSFILGQALDEQVTEHALHRPHGDLSER